MYEIHIKLRTVVTGEEANYRAPLKYKSRKEAAIDVFRYAEEISSKYQGTEEELTVSVVEAGEMKTRSTSRKNNGNGEKRFFVLGYAVNKRGLTKHAHATVYGTGPGEAIRRAAEGLEELGMTHFKALKVTQLSA